MPKKQIHVIARMRSLPTTPVPRLKREPEGARRPALGAGEQSLHKLLRTLAVLVILLSSCAPQPASVIPTATERPIISSTVEYHTFTPAPVEISLQKNQNGAQGQRVYALVAPFPTVMDGVTSEQLQQAWTQGVAPPAFSGHPLLMEQSTQDAISSLWDAPASGLVTIVPSDQLLDTAWSELGSWAIVPFEELQPKWKVLTIDGQSPIRKNFDITKYPLVVSADASNYDSSKLTTVVMTGITALVRATAYTMELKSIAYPGEKVRDLMREADIAHVANHVPFSAGCTFPKPDQGALVFCSDPKYIELFTDIGVDLVELTGHHFEDYGPKATLETLQIYKSHNIVYFGGGANKEDSIKPALFENHGNKIAFIGCNRLDTGGLPTATDTRPGAAPCDYPYLKGEISKLRAEGYVVIATMHWNQSYGWQPAPQQIKDFHFLVDSGASLVLGSQAHYAQTMEFYNGIFVHYGQGNLFFDQMGDQSWMPKGIRREFIDRYVIYNGKVISIELITTMLEDYSRPRFMTDAERSGFLQEYFNYSGWTTFPATPTATITPTLTPMSIPPLVGTGTPRPLLTATPTP
jgi:poly-gamma-glutamate synthesis protein (capsule biosynthesis protein)